MINTNTQYKIQSREQDILQVKNLSKTFKSGLIKVTLTRAVKNVNFSLKQGKILSLVGESGSGKSTINNMILRLLEPTEGQILLKGKDISKIPKKEYYKDVQVIFQDPFSSFNYFFKVDRLLKMAINYRFELINEKQQNQLIYNALKSVSLNPEEVIGRYPHQLSGGQLQRFLIARVLLIKPKVLIADEPTSMIDACARADILKLLKKLKEEEGFSILFITHDIGQAQYISDDVIVLNEGQIVESGSTKDVFLSPKQPYTKKLLGCCPSLYRTWY